MATAAQDTSKLLEETRTSLSRVSSFDATVLPRSNELGTSLDFSSAVEPAERVISLFRRLSPDALQEFPNQVLESIKTQADQVYRLFDQALKFSTAADAPAAQRDDIVQKIRDQYREVFQSISPYISFAVSRTVDFGRLESEGRAAVQSIDDRVGALVSNIEEKQQQIQKALDDVRAAAAEQGVSQQARYFKDEADNHDLAAKTWLKWTLISAAGLVVYSTASLFFHLIPGLDPTSTYDAVQLGASKLLVFIVIAYIVLTCGRNFMAHTHNAIVNRHRQNGLQTFTTLVDAAGSPQAQDIVLSHAAASIFEPQETGYAKQQQPQDGALSAGAVIRSLSTPHAQ